MIDSEVKEEGEILDDGQFSDLCNKVRNYHFLGWSKKAHLSVLENKFQVHFFFLIHTIISDAQNTKYYLQLTDFEYEECVRTYTVIQL